MVPSRRKRTRLLPRVENPRVSKVKNTRLQNGKTKYFVVLTNGSTGWIPDNIAEQNLTENTTYVLDHIGPRCIYNGKKYYMVKYKGFEEWYELLAENIEK